MTQLAYVSHDGRVYTTDSNADMVRPISGTDLICFWPTWARDGSRLAYSGLNRFGDDEGSYGVYVTSSGSGESRLRVRGHARQGLAANITRGRGWQEKTQASQKTKTTAERTP